MIIHPKCIRIALKIATLGPCWGVAICMENIHNKTAFDTNLAMVRKAGLTLSSKLLQLACKVYK
jgi:hypothetical protein